MPQPRIDDDTLIAVQHHMAQQAAFSQIPDVVKGVGATSCFYPFTSTHTTYSSSCTFTKQSLTITLQRSQWRTRVAGTSTRKSFMQKRNGRKLKSSHHWSMMVILILSYIPYNLWKLTTSVDQIFLILYRELYYRHVYSRLQPNIDDRFHSYENSCELFNYLLSA